MFNRLELNVNLLKLNDTLEEISTQNGHLTIIQIPCHHVLANEIFLNLKYLIVLKHFLNINLGIGIIKKTTFLFIFLTYLPMFLLMIERARWMHN